MHAIFGHMFRKLRTDVLDRKILQTLSSDSDVTPVRLGLSASAAYQRVKLLETGGYISGYRGHLPCSGARARCARTTASVSIA